MKLRIHRTFTWGYAGRMQDLRMGGDNQLTLIPHDELQYTNLHGINEDWRPVPIVEAEKPEHPHDKEERERMEGITSAIRNVFKSYSDFS